MKKHLSIFSLLFLFLCGCAGGSSPKMEDSSSGGGAYDRPVSPPSKNVSLKNAPAMDAENQGTRETDKTGITRAEPTKKESNTESYDRIEENPFLTVKYNPLSTFSIDVDTASYANIRRFLNEDQLPPKGAVRIEEMVNYFSYEYPDPSGKDPISTTIEVSECPWNLEHRLVRVGLKGKTISLEKRPAANLVFLLDVSGSMSEYNKLPWVKKSMEMLTRQLTEKDRVSIVVYAGAAGLVLPPTNEKEIILRAIKNLYAGGSTDGGSGIQLAYKVAKDNFVADGINRVILCTDGDFNVGTTSRDELVDLIEQNAKTGVFLTVLGFGMGNYKDATLQQLSDKGNGNYGYIDTLKESEKMLVHQMGGTLITIAKDVKIQIEFNPLLVDSYRLIGYEKRMLRAEDFKDDQKDAGEMGSGHTVTALYEITLAPQEALKGDPKVDPLKYQGERQPSQASKSGELLTLKIRYKEPKENTSKEMSVTAVDSGHKWTQASTDFKFAAGVAAFGMLLRDSKFMGKSTFALVHELAQEGKGEDQKGTRQEFIELVKKAKDLKMGKMD